MIVIGILGVLLIMGAAMVIGIGGILLGDPPESRVSLTPSQKREIYKKWS